ncbi:MAG: hypothetical protein GHCLOJNM_04113 [bacterium]|nr:hypothetical protein [bacterium]
MSKWFFRTVLAVLLFSGAVGAEVLDVNGDGIVGPEEALEISDQWRRQAKGAADHDHLGQFWSLNNNPLTISGSSTTGAFDVTNTGGYGIDVRSQSAAFGAFVSSQGGIGVWAKGGGDSQPDVMLGGSFNVDDNGVLASDLDDVNSDLVFISKDLLEIELDADNNDASFFRVRNGADTVVCQLDEAGNMNIAGQYQSTLKTTRVDHPLDPSGKYLNHFSVDSPQVLNLYNGNVTLDEEGEAVVDLPPYFEAYNTDYRYQLTCIGGFAPVFVAEEIRDGRFRIGGGKPGMKVSWEVTGVRQDPYVKAHPLSAEEDKAEEEKGRFLHPDLYGKGPDKSLYAGREP